nr:hypothetical protein [Leuven Picorna-like virus 12]
MAALAAAALGGSLISAGATVGSSIGTAALQEKNSTQLQQNDQKFQTSIINRGENSFTEAGLPKFLYWGGNNLNTSLPNTQTHLGGTAFAQSYGVNSNLPYYSNNPIPQYMGTAKPRPSTSQTAEGNRNLQNSKVQPSRPGLGFVPASTSTANTASAAQGGSIRMPGGNSAQIGSPEYQNSLKLIYNSRGVQAQPSTSNSSTSMRPYDFGVKSTSMMAGKSMFKQPY